MHMYTRTYLGTFLRTYIHSYVHTCIEAYMDAYMRIVPCSNNMKTYIDIYMQGCRQSRRFLYRFVPLHILHLHVCSQKRTCIHRSVCMSMLMACS